MFSRTSNTLKIALAGVALATMGAPAAADVVVTQVAGPAARDYPRGTRLRDDQAINLARGSTVIVLTSAGTRRWRGPGRFSADAGRVRGGSLSASSNVRAGATRSEGDTPYPTVWQVETTREGAFCYAPDVAVALWRPNTDADQTVTLTGPDGSSETVTIGAGQYSVPWPNTVAAVDNGEYTIQLQGEEAVTVTFVPLGTESEDTIDIATALGDQECYDQLQALADQVDESGD